MATPTSGIMPLFTSAPRLVLYVDNSPVAFAIGMDVSVSIDIQSVKCIGHYGPISLEPVMYNVVTGTMQIIRTISSAKLAEQGKAGVIVPNNITGTDAVVVGVDASGKAVTKTYDGTAGTGSSAIASINKLHMHTDPTKVLASSTFQIRLGMKIPVAQAVAGQPATATTAGFTASKSFKAESDTPENWLRIHNCRITGRNTNISLGALVNEPVNFMGTLITPMIGDSDLFGYDGGPSEKL